MRTAKPHDGGPGLLYDGLTRGLVVAILPSIVAWLLILVVLQRLV